MSALSALAFLVLASARNAARVALRRLGRPRHALAALFGAGWLLFVYASNRANVERGAGVLGPLGESGAAWASEVLALAVLCAVALGHWVLGRDEAALHFTEAEIQLLFPAPLTRRQLVAYKLAKGGLAALAVVVVLALLLGRGGLLARLGSAIAGWVALTTWMLHGTGASLTRAALARHGVEALRRRVFTIGIVVLAAAAAVMGMRRAPPLDAFPSGIAGALPWSRAVLDTEPLSWALYPMRASLDVAFAHGAPSLAKVVASVVALVLHVAWVFSSDVAFQESAVERARRAARRLDVIRGAGFEVPRRSRRRRTFRLRSSGRPEIALFWKACVRATRFVSVQVIALAIACVGLPVAVALVWSATGEAALPSAAILIALLFLVIALGSFFATGDLRRDLPHLDILRALPVRGREVVCGEIALPLAQLAAAQWLLLAIATHLSRFLVPWSLSERLAIAAAVAVVGPAVSAVGLLVQNALVVLYPSWFPRPGEVRLSLDRFGVPIMLGVATLVAVAVALVPAGVAGAVVFAVVRPWLGVLATPFAAIAGAGVIAVVVALGAVATGRAFDRLEPEA